MSDATAAVRRVYDAFVSGDIPGALGGFHPQIEWREAENFVYADRNPYIGPDAVLNGVFARLGADWEDFRVVPQEFIAQGDRVVSLGRYYGKSRATGKSVDARFAHVWRVQDGKITSFEQLTDTAQFSSAIV